MKKKVLILFIVMLAALLCFAACYNDPTVDGEVGVKSIEIIKGTVTTQFKVGDTPDFSGIKVKVVFEDNTTKEIGYTDVTVSDLDTSTAGKKTVTVTYNGVSVNFEVNVVEEEVAPTVTSIKIVPGTLNLDYYIGQTPDTSTLQVEATYSNGITSALKVEEYTFTTIDTSTSGEKTFTVTYTGNTELTDSVKITVAPISSITVITGSVKNKLNVGETLDTSKIQVAVEYENGKGEVVEFYNLTVGTVDTTTYGKKSLSITYKGITIEYPVEVVGMVSLTVNKGSYPETVKLGSTVDTSGITAVVEYSDGVQKPLVATDLKFGTVSTAAVGKQNLAVSYENAETNEKVETTVEINVIGVKTLTVVDNTVSKEILKGNTLDLGEIMVSVEYTDGSTDSVGFDELTFGSFDTNVAGDKAIGITYLDKTVEYSIKVCEITSLVIEGVADSVQSGKPIDITNMKVYGVYNDSKLTKTSEPLNAADYTTNIEKLNTEQLNSTAARTLTVDYNGVEGTWTVYTTDPELIEIEISNFDTEVLLNGGYDKNSVTVTATYGNGTEKTIYASNLTIEIATNVAGDTTLTVTYEGKTATATVKVCTITSIRIEKNPDSVQSGNDIVLSGMKVVGVYNDTAKTTVELTEGITTTIDTVNKNKVGPQTFTVTYNGALGSGTAEATIVLTDPALVGIEIENFADEVLINGTYNTNNLVVKAIYGNDTTATISVSDLTINIATNVAGDTTLTVTYGGKTATATVKVCTITSIRIEKNPDSVQSGNDIVLSGMKVVGVYNDTAKTTVELTEGITTTIDTVNKNKVGPQPFTVTYNGALGSGTAEATIVLTDPALVGIKIDTFADEVLINHEYNKNSVTVIATYGNETTKIISSSDLTINIATNVAGDTILTVTYEGKTATATVKVCTISKIVIKGVSNHLPAGEELDLSTIEIWGVYDNADKDEIRLTAGTYTSNKADIDANTDENAAMTLQVTYTDDVWGELKGTFNISAQAPILESIKITKWDKEVFVNHIYNKDNVVVTAYYGNGTSKEVTGFTVEDVATTVGGDTTLTVTYEGKTATETVKVCTITSIRIEKNPDSVQSGNEIVLSGMKVVGVYNDNAGTTVELTEGITTTIDTVNKNKVGPQPFTVTYNGALGSGTAEATIDLTAPALVGIKIDTFANEVLINHEYNKNSVTVIATYGNETTKIISSSDLTINIATNVAGDTTLTVTYEGKTATETVKVCTITSIRIDKNPDPVQSGNEIVLSGMKVVGVYNDNAGTTVELTEGITTTIDTVNKNKVGPQTFTVTYNGALGSGTAEATIELTAPALVGIKIDTFANEVLINHEYNKNSVTVIATYGNETTKIISSSDLTINIATNVAGDTTLTVTYEGKTATETVKVCTITSLIIEGVESSIASGKPINIDNIKVYGVYNDSKNTKTTEPLNKADYTTNIGELNANVNGMESRVLVVTYTNGAKGTFEITVTAPEMAGITITNWDKTIGLGGVYNKDSVVIAAILGNGTTGQITVPGTVSISDVVTSVAGEVEFTVTYTTEAGATYTATAKVTVLSISRLEVSGVPAVVNRGEALDLSKMKVTAFFSDGSSRVVNVSEITTTTPDTSAGGNKAFTVKYLGFDQTVSYHVRSITSIKILSGSVNTALRAGYEVDVSGLILDITYSNGDREQKKASELTGVTYTGTGKGSTTFTVTFKYNENEKCSDSVSLTQITVTKISALNNTIPSLVMQGTKLDFSSMSLSVYYDNGEVYLVPLPEPGKDPVDPYLTVDYSGVDTSKPGSQAISFYYRDGISINHAYDALLGAGAINAAQYEVLKYNFDTSVNFTVRGIATVEIVAGTVYDKIYVGKTVDTSGISVKVTYDDGTYIYVNRNNTALTVYDSKDDIDTSKEGKVKLWVEFSGVRGSMDIEVEKMPETSGVIVGVLLPDTIVARESYKKNFLDYSPERPSNPYYVGDDNLFYFYLDVIELDENDNVVEKDGKKTPTAGKVYLVDGNTETELTGDNLALYVTVDYSKNSYDFTENAIGKTFRLEIRPDGTSENTSLKRSYSVTVVDGYNVYEAWELNVMTNVHRDITQKCFGADGMIYQDKVVDEFLLGKGVTRPATLASIVLHGNLDVKLSDIPPEYSYVDEKGVNQGLYNQLGVFHRELTTEQKEFKIYGNYFSVYSYSLPCVVPNNVANNTKDGGFSSSALFKSTLSSGACDYIRGKATKEAFSEFVVNIQDIATRDNDPNSNDQTASERHMRGLSCYKVGEMRVDMTAVNVEAFMTSVVCENMGSTLNLNKVKLYNAWQTHLFLWNQNEIQNTKEGEKAETWGYVPNLTVNINSSEITKCGGPVILAQAPNVDELYNRTCGVEVHVDEKLVSADDNKSKLSTYVTGQEAWFVAVGQTQIAAQVRAMSTTIGNGCGFTSTGHIQGVETVNMIMVAMGNNGTSLNGTTSNVLYSRDGKVVMQSHHPENKTTFQTTVRDNTIEYVIAQDPANYAPLRYAPLFETETGGLGYIDASMKCNPLNASLYTGDYITLYYTSLGANIMMEYYSVNP